MLKLDNKILRKLQKQEIKCLKELKRICEENNINYFLIGGTLIGAVRNKGFIPWDDDIDIGMLRDDFDRFCKICPEKINHDLFFLQTPETEKNNADFEIARIRLNNTHIVQRHRKELKLHDGFFIEIIPYDDLPDNNLKATFYSLYFRFLKRLVGERFGYHYTIFNKYKRVFYKFTLFFFRFIPVNKLYSKMINYHKKYYNTNSKYVFLLAGAYNWKKERHLRETIKSYSNLEFEGELYPVPKDYDLFLTEQYGDYMTPPAKEEQINKCYVECIDFGPYEDEE